MDMMAPLDAQYARWSVPPTAEGEAELTIAPPLCAIVVVAERRHRVAVDIGQADGDGPADTGCPAADQGHPARGAAR